MAVKPEDYLFSPLKMKQVLKNALLTEDQRAIGTPFVG